MPYEEQIPGERFKPGERIRALLLAVEETPRGIFLKLSRSHPDFLINLFAIEGYSHKEIGQMLSISEGTSKSQYNRAKSLLKVKLHQQEKRHEKYGEGKV